MTKDNHLLGKFELSGIPPAPRGTPQIEVTFEIDQNGILNVSAQDKGTGRKEQITITSDNGRLSPDEIEKMIKDAEKFSSEDKKVREKIESRNSLESYAHSMKSTCEDKDKLADKMGKEDKITILEAVKEAEEFLSNNQNAEPEEYKDKLKHLESICNPIISKIYGQSGGPGSASPGAPVQDDDFGAHDEL